MESILEQIAELSKKDEAYRSSLEDVAICGCPKGVWWYSVYPYARPMTIYPSFQHELDEMAIDWGCGVKVQWPTGGILTTEDFR